MDTEIRCITSSEEAPVYNRVAYLFSEMHDYMDDKGLVNKLVDNGEYLWINTVKRTLGKFNVIVVAIQEGLIVGFAAGNIRVLPNYLGNKKVGYISHMFVSDKYKNKNIGNKLLEKLEDWFSEKSVQHIELEVLIQNEAACRFWKKKGFITDNLRMVKVNGKV